MDPRVMACHPVYAEMFPEFQEDKILFFYSSFLWSVLGGYKGAANMNKSPVVERPWKKPELQRKPMITLRRKLEFLRRKQEYNMKRDAHIVTVTITAQDHNTLELSVSLYTSLRVMASTFLQTRNLDLKPEYPCLPIFNNNKNDGGLFEELDPGSTVSDFTKYPDTKMSINLLFDRALIKLYRQTLWMETECDWYLWIMFTDIIICRCTIFW